jgi:hypothetical protein
VLDFNTRLIQLMFSACRNSSSETTSFHMPAHDASSGETPCLARSLQRRRHPEPHASA